jgi:predicted NACHT family NTPase/WD40 repeat protein
MFDLGGLISSILGFGTEIGKNKLQRNELVIKLLKKLKLNPDHPPADFTAVYQYALVEYGIGKPQPVLEIFRQSEIHQIFRRALDLNNPAILLTEGEEFLSGHMLGNELQSLGMNVHREFYEFAAVFIEIANRTRTPAEVLTNQRLESVHLQIGIIQERLNRLPTLEGIRTEIARLVEQDLLVGLSSESSTAKQCRAFALAQQMRGWFETLSYRFEKYEVWENDYFEWIINIPTRRNRFDRILIRGVEGEVGLRDVTLLQQAVETQQTDEGWLVTLRRLSRAARDEVKKPENSHLCCYTFDELVDLDADFSGYIEWLETEIQHRGIDSKYVPLACTKEELDPVTKQLFTVSRYDERDGWIDGYCDRWLDDSTKEHISILGEFGTGKTWFAFHYAWVALKRYQEAKARGMQRPRLPLVITLRDYAKALNVENVLAGFFFTKHNIRLNREVFDQLNRMGKLLLIFDGFDEMAAKVDKQQMINNFWELAKVVVPGAKVILTCRTEHFPKAQDGRDLLNAELKASTANLTGETPQFEVLELEKFTNEQVRHILSFQATPKTVEKVIDNSHLLDLARRPVMIELILEALPDIELGKPIDISRVYLYAVRRKMERDIKAERTFTSLADKLYFLCELSWEMLSTEQMSLNYRLFPDRIRKLFGKIVQEEKDLDHWHYDMMGQTMLIRNNDGDYTPAHRSLLEFFVAYKFAAEMGVLAPDFLELAENKLSNDSEKIISGQSWQTYFGNQLIEVNIPFDYKQQNLFISESISYLANTVGKHIFTKVVIDMLVPMISSSKLLWKILSETQFKTVEEVQYLAGNIITLLRHLGADFSYKDLSNLHIFGANFSNLNLENSDFRSSKISRCNFSNTNLTNTNFCFAEFNDISWGEYGGIYCVDISPSKRVVVAGIQGQGVKIWGTESGNLLKELPIIDTIYCVKFSHDGNFLGATTRSGSIFIWETEFYGLIHHSLHQNQAIESFCFNINNTIIFYITSAGIEAINIISGKCYGVIKSNFSKPTLLAYDITNNRIVISNLDGHIASFSWNESTLSLIKIYRDHDSSIRSININTIQDNIVAVATGGKDKKISIRNLTQGNSIASGVLESTIFSVALRPMSKQIAISLHGQKLLILQIPELSILFSLEPLHKENVREICYSNDGSLLLSAGYDGQLIIWSADTYEKNICIEGSGETKRKIICNGMNFKNASGLTEEYIKFFEDRGAIKINDI